MERPVNYWVMFSTHGSWAFKRKWTAAVAAMCDGWSLWYSWIERERSPSWSWSVGSCLAT